MFAGHEANGDTFIFVILLLACHPEIQKELQESLDSFLVPREDFGVFSYHINYEQRFNTLARGIVSTVISESLRLFTVLHFPFRDAFRRLHRQWQSNCSTDRRPYFLLVP